MGTLALNPKFVHKLACASLPCLSWSPPAHVGPSLVAASPPHRGAGARVRARSCPHTRISRAVDCAGAQVPLAIGGPGLAEGVRLKEGGDLPRDAGLTNVTATFMNLLGFRAPSHMRETLLA